MLKRNHRTKIIFIVCMFLLTGCTIEQKEPMGANSNLDEGFNGYGTLRMRELEGPLTDMSIPDETVKGRTKIADKIADGEPYYAKEPNLGFKGNKDGVNIHSGRAALVNDDKHMTSDRPYLEKGQQSLGTNSGTIAEQVIQRLGHFNSIKNVYAVSDDGYLLVGVESGEQDRSKLLREVEKEIEKITPLDNVKIALDRKNITRIKKLQQKLGQ